MTTPRQHQPNQSINAHVHSRSRQAHVQVIVYLVHIIYIDVTCFQNETLCQENRSHVAIERIEIRAVALGGGNAIVDDSRDSGLSHCVSESFVALLRQHSS